MAASSFLLHNGLIVDGTGNVEPFTGNLLLSHGEIESSKSATEVEDP